MNKLLTLVVCSLPFALAACSGADAGTSSVAAPTIINEPAAIKASAGDPASFKVVATGPALSYQWYKMGEPISGATGAAYTIDSVSAADAATYYVVVANSAGSSESFKRPLSLKTKGWDFN
jgi:hypothetical protein